MFVAEIFSESTSLNPTRIDVSNLNTSRYRLRYTHSETCGRFRQQLRSSPTNRPERYYARLSRRGTT